MTPLSEPGGGGVSYVLGQFQNWPRNFYLTHQYVILHHIFSDKKFGFRVFPAESNGLGDALKGIRDTLRYLKLG